MFKKFNLMIELKKMKNINKKQANKIEELEANNEFLFNENQILKAKLRGVINNDKGR